MKLTDEQRMDWLQGQGVTVIYLTNGTSIGIFSGSVRDAIDKHISRTEAQSSEGPTP